MIDRMQQAYLEAMGIQLWSAREAQQTQAPLVEPSVVQPSVVQPSVVQPVVNKPALDEGAAAVDAGGLKLGAGSGGTLLICAMDTDSASKLANDISRSLGKVPVWGWPDASAESIKPLEAVAENLFTTVAVFGEELAGRLFGLDVPDNLNSARLVLLPAMRELEATQEARRELWATMCRSGMVAVS